MGEYLVIKLKGNWIEREQTKKRVEMFFNDLDIMSAENVVTYKFAQKIEKEHSYRYEAFKDYSKRRIANALGEQFLGDGVICFNESEDENGIKIEGVITVISETQKNDF